MLGQCRAIQNNYKCATVRLTFRFLQLKLVYPEFYILNLTAFNAGMVTALSNRIGDVIILLSIALNIFDCVALFH